MIEFLIGWLLLTIAALLAFHFVVRPAVRPPDPVDEQFETAAREPSDVVDLDRIDRIFADMTTELPDLRERPAQLSAYYLRKEEHG